MAELNETPRGNRIHIAFFGLRNAGKSTLVNAFTGQQIAIVSDVPGTTTDPVSKAMEILPLGPCLVTDTAGLDDEGELGEMRVEKTLKVLETTDIAVWVDGLVGTTENAEKRKDFFAACKQLNVTVIEYRRGDSVEELKKKIAAVKLEDKVPGLLDGLVEKGDHVVCVCPIDESAPKGRLILPQVQVIRECLDRHVTVTVCQPEDLRLETEDAGRKPDLVITDSQAFGEVSECVKRRNQAIEQSNNPNNRTIRLTSFSVLFARQKGDLDEFAKGLKAIKGLKDGDTVLVAEGCTHHRQCNDIGTVKIPKALEKLSGRKLKFEFASGGAFDVPAPVAEDRDGTVKLIVHCGGCMLTRREMLRRIAIAKEAGVPIVNYGLVLAMANGINIQSLIPNPQSLIPILMIKANYHTHTTWCDGKDSPRKVIQAAVAKGFEAIGFSSHAMLPESDTDWVLTPEKAPRYLREVRALGEEFKDQIRVLCGVEADYVPGGANPDRSTYAAIFPDYIIGSIHWVVAEDGARVPVDHTPELLADGIREHFEGSAEKFIRAYYRQVREMVEKFDFEIVGHLDLVRKFNAKHPYFDEKADWYREEIGKTAAAVAKSGKLAEVNTGAISRGWMDDAYPSEEFRGMLREKGVKFILSSDAHAADAIDCAFDRFVRAETFVDMT